MQEKNMGFEEAFSYASRSRPIIFPNMGFQRQLAEFERLLKVKKKYSAPLLISKDQVKRPGPPALEHGSFRNINENTNVSSSVKLQAKEGPGPHFGRHPYLDKTVREVQGFLNSHQKQANNFLLGDVYQGQRNLKTNVQTKQLNSVANGRHKLNSGLNYHEAGGLAPGAYSNPKPLVQMVKFEMNRRNRQSQ
mmetsp:Transcript_17566/g.29652  ORF Transcript_17566/g.29652 Transcript_17566/m.29652 type:complete len:192 (+) Transcript_17566:291-866(+)